jgi:peptide/nickel transport system substrate-binding protein
VQQSALKNTTIQLGTINFSPVALDTQQALATEWAAVGIKTTLPSWNLTGLIQAFTAKGGKSWQSMIQTAGAFDPAAAIGLAFRFSSFSPFSGVHDPKLDAMINQGQSYTDLSKRCQVYNQAQKYIADNYDGPFFFSLNPTAVSAKGITGPGLTSPLPAVAVTPTIPWESVYDNPAS